MTRSRARQVEPAATTRYGSAQPVSPRGMNALAIMSVVSVFVFGPLAVILGHAARHQIRRSGESGAGIALGALIIGYVETAALVALVIAIATQSASYSS
jgi:hypothetical protein